MAVIYDRLHTGSLDYRETHLEGEVKDLRRDDVVDMRS